jgi:hypothetical protein
VYNVGSAGVIALSSSWTGRVDNGQIRINEKKNTGDLNLLYQLQVNFLILVKGGSTVPY